MYDHATEGTLANAAHAIRHLSRAAACAEKADEKGVRGADAMIWFATRALAAEFGCNYDEIVRSARHYANEYFADRVNVI